jgi:hypothetical protein
MLTQKLAQLMAQVQHQRTQQLEILKDEAAGAILGGEGCGSLASCVMYNSDAGCNSLVNCIVYNEYE